MRSTIAQRMLDRMPADVKIYTDKYADLVVLINSILKEKGYTQKTLADKLDKSPSEINKWLSGDHNFTLRSIAKLEAELGEVLLQVSSKAKKSELAINHFFETEMSFRSGVFVTAESCEGEKCLGNTKWMYQPKTFLTMETEKLPCSNEW